MPKRKAEDKIRRYEEKIQKLKGKQKVHRRRIISDSESDVENQDIHTPENVHIDVTNHEPTIPDDTFQYLPEDIPLSSETCLPQICVEGISKNCVEHRNTVPETSIEVPNELDPEIRLALGDHFEDSPQYGANIHNDLAQRWLPVLKKGLGKEFKEKLLKEHHVPDNCRLLKAPRLNPEIAAAVAEVVRARDKKMEGRQNQLGLGITAISRAMEMIINDGNKVSIIKQLSEGCRILTDLHFTETQIRTKCITPCLDKSILNIIQEDERDEFLFGNKLSEKIKAAKAIEKQGWQIKRNIPQKVNQNQSQQRIRHPGNWTPPPRYTSSSSRGGRGAYTASRAHPNRQFRAQAPPPLAVQTQPRAATATKQRAPTRQ